jgi:flagellum-specific peptidoglycan hydrolase FlgJ
MYMFKKIIVFLIVSLFVACSANKPVVRTTKSTASKPVAKTVKKPISKPVETKKNETSVAANEQNKESKTEVLEATSKVKVTTEIVLAYIEKFKEIAKTNMKNHGVPASIVLAQAILESGAGTGDLSNQANNHFGIKCHKDWSGASVKHDDDEDQECFRKYVEAIDSYADHVAFLKGRKWYQPLFKLDKDDYKGWAHGLKKAGYATDPNYPSKLIGIIERYQLNKYDAEVLGKVFVATNQNLSDKSNEKRVFKEGVHEVVKGDTLYSLSKKYNISVDDLKRKNSLSENAISIGQLLEVK